MSWSNDVVLQFLELYRQEQLLWDPKHPLHRNRTEVTDAWLRIQNSLNINCSILDLKKKKESLMTSFRMHLSKKRKCPDGYHTTWFAFPMMESFLGGKYECDSTNQIDDGFYHNVPQYNTLSSVPENNIVRNTNEGKANTVPRQVVRSTIPQKVNSTNTDVVYTKNQMRETVNYMKKEEYHMDEYELYGQLLAKKLRKLDEHQRDVAMHEIDNIMFRVKMQSGSQSRSYSSSPSPVPRKMKSPVFILGQTTQQFEDDNITYQDQPPT